MRNSAGKRNRLGLLIGCVVLFAAAALPLLSRATPRPPATSINVVNSSNWEIRHLYLSAVAEDNWSADQLGGSVLHTGDSFVLDNVTCDSAQIKVISEDKDGCFISQAVACGASATWTITADATPNCGGN
jgi:hypothetical protein